MSLNSGNQPIHLNYFHRQFKLLLMEKPNRPTAAPLLLEAALEPLEDATTLFVEAEKAVRAFFREGQSANTARTYKTALQYWGAWHALRFGSAIEGPVSASIVVQFLQVHAASVAACDRPATGGAQVQGQDRPVVDCHGAYTPGCSVQGA